MRTNQLLSLTDILQRPVIARWQHRFAISTTHDCIWRNVLDESLRSSCRLYSYQQGVLTVAVYHTTAANQLRYLNRILIQQLKTHEAFSALSTIRTITKPAPVQPKTKTALGYKKQQLRISRNTAEHLITIANGTSDLELSKKLRDLARHSD